MAVTDTVSGWFCELTPLTLYRTLLTHFTDVQVKIQVSQWHCLRWHGLVRVEDGRKNFFKNIMLSVEGRTSFPRVERWHGAAFR